MVIARRRHSVSIAAVFALALMAVPAGAINWIDPGTDDWTDGSNWNTGLQPGTGDKADIYNGGTAYIATNVGSIQRFELAGPAGTSGHLDIRDGGVLTTTSSSNTYVGARGTSVVTIAADGGGGGGSLTIGSGPLNVGWRGDSGANGDGTIIQNGGTVVLGRNMDLGQNDANTRGRYEIHDGTLTVATWVQVGRRGVGEFLQTGGTVNVNRSSGDPALMIGSQGGSTGTYTMTGGILNVPSLQMVVGKDSTGTFAQSNGTVTCGHDLILGNSSGVTGTYTLDDGSLSAGTMIVGREGTGLFTLNDGSVANSSGIYVGQLGAADGTFVQNGGIVNANHNIDIGREGATAKGRYEIHDGTLNVAQWMQVGRQGVGEFLQTGGTVNVNRSSGDPALMVGSQAGSTGTYTMTGGILNVPSIDMAVGERGTGTFQLDDGTCNFGDAFVVGKRDAGDGTFIQNGGTVNASSYLNIGHDSATATGRYEMHGGTLNVAAHLQVGRLGTGTLIQTGGDINSTNTAVGSGFYVGAQSGSSGLYQMSGGTLTVAGETIVGRNSGAAGTMELSGDAVLSTNELWVGENGTGTVRVGGNAQLDVRTNGTNFRIGNSGDGTLIQTGGTVTQPGNGGAMYIGFAAGSTGQYTISGGILDQGLLTIGYTSGGSGALTQTGGDVFARRDVRIGRGSGSAAYSISDGTLTVTSQHGPGDLAVGFEGSATSTFTQSGGIVDVDHHAILGNGSTTTGTYTMSGGTLDMDNELRVGYDGSGTFIQTGGDVTTGDSVRLAVNSASSVGRYEIHGGTLTTSGTANGYLQVGRLGTGTFIQTGGTVTVNRANDALNIGDKSGGRGTYRISGGTLNVVNHNTGVGVAGTGLLDVLGSAADINTFGYSQNSLSTLRSAIDNGGISTVNVSDAATISPGAMLDVDVWGGVAFSQGTPFDLLRTATAGNISGTLTVVDPEPIWAVTQDGTVVQATLTGPGQGPGDLGPNGCFEVAINAGAGSATDYLPILGTHDGERIWILLDLVDAQGDLDAAALDQLAAEMALAGQKAYTDHWTLDAQPDFDLALEIQSTEPMNFIWDFSDYEPNPGLMVTRVRGVIPEPATLSLLGLGGLLLAARRRRR